MKKLAIGLVLLMVGLIPALAQIDNTTNETNTTEVNTTDTNLTNVTVNDTLDVNTTLNITNVTNVTDNATNVSDVNTTNQTNVSNETNVTRSNSTLLNGLVAYYPEDNESNHNDAADSHHGVVMNGTGTPVFTTGKVNGAYAYSNAFAEEDSRVLANVSELANATSATISAWVNIQNNSGLLMQLHSNQPHGNKNLLRLDNGRIGWSLGNGLDDETKTQSLAEVNNGEWHYYTLQWDKTLGMTRIYVDGILQEQLGVQKFGPDTDHFAWGAGFNGYGASSTLDEIAIWNRLLTLEEIAQLYNNGTGMSIPLVAPIQNISNDTNITPGNLSNVSNQTNVTDNQTNQTTISVSLEAVPNITYIFTCNAQGFVPTYYDWDFGDNTTLVNGTNQTVTYMYATAGNFSVSCLARNDGTSGNATLPIGG